MSSLQTDTRSIAGPAAAPTDAASPAAGLADFSDVPETARGALLHRTVADARGRRFRDAPACRRATALRGEEHTFAPSAETWPAGRGVR